MSWHPAGCGDAAEIIFHRLFCEKTPIHFFGEEMTRAAAAVLGVMERDIRPFQELYEARSIARRLRNADRCADHDLAILGVEGFGETALDSVGQIVDLVAGGPGTEARQFALKRSAADFTSRSPDFCRGL